MRRLFMAGTATALLSFAFAAAAQAAPPSARGAHSGAPAAAKKAPKPKEYELNEDGTWYPGDNLQLFSSTHTWAIANTEEVGTFKTSGKSIVLTETMSQACVFTGVKGKHGIVYEGTFSCRDGGLTGTWEVRKL